MAGTDAGTITGSIGVLGGKFNIAPMAAKLGVNSDAVSRGANVSMFDQFTNFTPPQRSLFEAQLNDAYKRFVTLVAKSRHLSFEDADSIAQGRVWTGMQALHLKLIDQIGDFSAALKEAREKHARCEIGADALKAVEDREIEALIRKQEAIGLKAITDGEFRRRNFMSDFTDAVEGFDLGDDGRVGRLSRRDLDQRDQIGWIQPMHVEKAFGVLDRA